MKGPAPGLRELRKPGKLALRPRTASSQTAMVPRRAGGGDGTCATANRVAERGAIAEGGGATRSRQASPASDEPSTPSVRPALCHTRSPRPLCAQAKGQSCQLSGLPAGFVCPLKASPAGRNLFSREKPWCHPPSTPTGTARRPSTLVEMAVPVETVAVSTRGSR